MLPVAAALCLLVLSACGGGQGGEGFGEMPPVAVETIELQPRVFPRIIAAVGSLASPQSTLVSAEIAGRIDQLDIPEGRRVDKGHLLARIDDGETKAKLSVARARFDNAKDRLARLRSLRSERVIAQQDLDDALAELRAAEGELEAAKTLQDKTEIRAPFTGIVGLRQVNPGAYINVGTPIVKLTQLDPLDLIFSVPEKFATEVAVGQKVHGTTSGCAETFEGALSVVEPFVDPVNRVINLQASVKNEAGKLRPGMSISVRLEIEQIEDALLIPAEAVIQQGRSRAVYTVSEDGTPVRHDVRLGHIGPTLVQVVEGLSAGDIVVTAGHQKLRPGAKAAPQPREDVVNDKFDLGISGADDACSL